MELRVAGRELRVYEHGDVRCEAASRKVDEDMNQNGKLTGEAANQIHRYLISYFQNFATRMEHL